MENLVYNLFFDQPTAAPLLLATCTSLPEAIERALKYADVRNLNIGRQENLYITEEKVNKILFNRGNDQKIVWDYAEEIDDAKFKQARLEENFRSFAKNFIQEEGLTSFSNQVEKIFQEEGCFLPTYWRVNEVAQEQLQRNLSTEEIEILCGKLRNVDDPFREIIEEEIDELGK